MLRSGPWLGPKSNRSVKAESGKDVKYEVILCFQSGASLLDVDRSLKTSNGNHGTAEAWIGGKNGEIEKTSVYLIPKSEKQKSTGSSI